MRYLSVDFHCAAADYGLSGHFPSATHWHVMEITVPGTLAKDHWFANTLASRLSILRAFRARDDRLGNSEIAARTGLPNSSVPRLTFAPESLGYLTHNRRHGSYRLVPSVSALGNIATASLPFLQFANPLMRRLADYVGPNLQATVQDHERAGGQPATMRLQG